jgi:hypothetical protein
MTHDYLVIVKQRAALSLEAAVAWIVARAVVRDWPPHDDEAGRLKFGDQALGDHLRHRAA